MSHVNVSNTCTPANIRRQRMVTTVAIRDDLFNTCTEFLKMKVPECARGV